MHSNILTTLRLAGLCLWGLMPSAFAMGTAAGTQVLNTVEVSFRFGDNPDALRVERATDTFTVAEIIRSNVSTLNPDGVATATPGKDVPLSFQLTNTGNAPEVFLLSSQAGAAGDFQAASIQLWLESNGEPGWQPDDTPYNAASGVALTADEAVVVYTVSDIPAALADQAQGDVLLAATAATQGAANLMIGQAVPAADNGGVEAVVAQDNARTQGQGAYVVSAIRLNVDKTIVSVQDPYGGNRVMPGAMITYQVTVSVIGVGTAKALQIQDPAPENMSYQRNTLTLNGVALSDSVDGDAGHFDAALNTVWLTPGTVEAPLEQVYTLTYVVD